MLWLRFLLVCSVVPIVCSSFVDEDRTSLVQLTVERNWKRGKVKQAPAQAAEVDMEGMEDDISFMQTQVTNEHRIKSASDHSLDCDTVAAGVDIGAEGSATNRGRPPLELDDSLDSFSLMQIKAEHQRRSPNFVDSISAQSLDEMIDSDSDAEAMEVSLLQTNLQVQRRPVPRSPALAPEKIADSNAESPELGQPDVEKRSWLTLFFDKLAIRSWELQEWASFALCLLILECVVWKATQTGGLKSKDLRMMRSWGASKSPTSPKRLSLTLPLRQLLDHNGGAVKLFGSSDGLAYVATLLKDSETGERTVQLAEAAEPTQAVMSVGPLPQSGNFEEGAAVHRYTTGYTLGALQSTGPDSWSLSKNGQTTLQMTSSAPFTLTISINDPETKEVAWVKPLSEAKEPDYVDLSICEGGDSMLPVACAVAVLIASSACPMQEIEEDEDI